MEEMTKHGQAGLAAMRAGMDPKTARKYVRGPLCQRHVRQLSLDISVPMGGEWFPVRAQAFPDSRSFNSSLGERSQAA
jgi:hypothetical protein